MQQCDGVCAKHVSPCTPSRQTLKNEVNGAREGDKTQGGNEGMRGGGDGG